MCGLSLKGGDRVVFTGEMSRPRSQWEAAAREVGLVPGAVTKATTVVWRPTPTAAAGRRPRPAATASRSSPKDLFAQLLDAMSS